MKEKVGPFAFKRAGRIRQFDKMIEEEVESNNKNETETKGRYQVKKNSMKPIDPRAIKNQLNYQDPNVIIQNLSTTRRYLTSNVY